MILILILLAILVYLSCKPEKFSENDIKKRIKSHIDCERELQLPRSDNLGKTKCFSCEDQIINNMGEDYVSLAQPEKCFSCEKQLINEKRKNIK
jgi:hypothetical protein